VHVSLLRWYDVINDVTGDILNDASVCNQTEAWLTTTCAVHWFGETPPGDIKIIHAELRDYHAGVDVHYPDVCFGASLHLRCVRGLRTMPEITRRQHRTRLNLDTDVYFAAACHKTDHRRGGLYLKRWNVEMGALLQRREG